MLLTGTFVRVVDEKQRITLPKRIRETLASGKESSAQALFLTPGTDGSLALYTEDVLTELGHRLANSSPNGRDVRAFSRLFYAQAEHVELDDQGRLRIPSQLALLAGLTNEAVLIGVQDHLEIWDRTRWEAYLAARTKDFDQIAEQAFVVKSS
ncbi:MAG: division/cell wall cluster transcriptional repressor MraZ [Planctomycetaceae bacterium]|nr:division/cell wall cluster transcriptional repressor MraZ [Planctomycetaceae bacterium]